MFELTAEAIILLLRLALIGLLYLFVALVVVAAGRELRRAALAAPDARVRGPGARLVVVDPGDTSLIPGETLSLRPVTRLGRAEGNTIVLDGTYISADHAAIIQRDGSWWLADRGSTNGTALNDRPVNGEVGLTPGDVIGIGDVRLRIVR
ncbi:MAG: FHA domain-containing protein [Chloroflexi bacterium]|nr:FHA domain-containing protein [Chloroflexota bacterium]